jgi:tetratricopeptide (TPR) repeat protein
MKRDSYKHHYPRTLLADALALLMQSKDMSICELSGAAGINRGTISETLDTTRSLSSNVRQKLFQALLADEKAAGELSTLFAGDSAELLKIPALISGMISGMMHNNPDADKTERIGRLCGGYGRAAIERDILAMRTAWRYPIAIRWCKHLESSAREGGDFRAQARGHLYGGMTKLAGATPGARDDLNSARKLAGERKDGDGQWKLLDAAAQCHLGWLSFEEGRHGRAIMECDNAIASLGPPFQTGQLLKEILAGRSAAWLRAPPGETEQAVPDGAIPSERELINLAFHIRAKALAEFAMYAYEFEAANKRSHRRCYIDAGTALIESYALSVSLGAAGLSGHGLLWLARLLAHWRADLGAGGSYDLVDLYGILEKEFALGRQAMAKLNKILAGDLEPRELLAKATYEHFRHFQSALPAQAYYERAKGCIYACRGESDHARKYFKNAIYDFTHDVPDAHGLGPIYHELSMLSRAGGKVRESCEYALAAAAVHPAGFILEQAKKCLGRPPAPDAGKQIMDQILEFRHPFEDLQYLSRRLWADQAESILRANMNLA